MTRYLKNIKISGIAAYKEKDLTDLISTIHNKNPYRFKICLMDDYWQWNFSSPYITISEEELKDNLILAESDKEMNFRSSNKNIFLFKDENKNEKNRPSFSTQFGDWTIEKGDYILPPPEIRFRRTKKAILKKAKQELFRMVIILPITVLIIIYILKAIFETT